MITILFIFMLEFLLNDNVVMAKEKNLNKIPNEEVLIQYEENGNILILTENNEELFILNGTADVVYSTERLNLRKGPTTLSKKELTVEKNDGLFRIGHSDFGWDLILKDNKLVFAWNKYLSETKIPQEK